MSIPQRRPLWSTMRWKHPYWERAEVTCWANARRDKRCECAPDFFIEMEWLKRSFNLFFTVSFDFVFPLSALLPPSTDLHCCTQTLFISLRFFCIWIGFIKWDWSLKSPPCCCCTSHPSLCPLVLPPVSVWKVSLPVQMWGLWPRKLWRSVSSSLLPVYLRWSSSFTTCRTGSHHQWRAKVSHITINIPLRSPNVHIFQQNVFRKWNLM